MRKVDMFSLEDFSRSFFDKLIVLTFEDIFTSLLVLSLTSSLT